MRPDSRTILVLAAAGVLVLTLASSVDAQRPTPQGRRGGPPEPTQPAAKTSSPADEATTRRICAICHPFEHIVAIRRTRSQWEATVESMVARGARGTPAELAAIINYLSENYGLGGATVRLKSIPLQCAQRAVVRRQTRSSAERRRYWTGVTWGVLCAVNALD